MAAEKGQSLGEGELWGSESDDADWEPEEEDLKEDDLGDRCGNDGDDGGVAKVVAVGSKRRGSGSSSGGVGRGVRRGGIALDEEEGGVFEDGRTKLAVELEKECMDLIEDTHQAEKKRRIESAGENMGGGDTGSDEIVPKVVGEEDEIMVRDEGKGQEGQEQEELWASESGDEDWEPGAEDKEESEHESDLNDTCGTGADRPIPIVAIGSKRRGSNADYQIVSQKISQENEVMPKGSDNCGDGDAIQSTVSKKEEHEEILRNNKAENEQDEIVPLPADWDDDQDKLNADNNDARVNVEKDTRLKEKEKKFIPSLTNVTASTSAATRTADSQAHHKIVDDKQLFAALNKPISRTKRPKTSDVRDIGMNRPGGGLSSVLGGTSLVRRDGRTATGVLSGEMFGLLGEAELERGSGSVGTQKGGSKDSTVGVGGGGSSGLDAMVKELRKGTKTSGVLDKSREAWKDYKEGNEEVKVELEGHRKDKNRYTDKVGFLKRVEVREWEKEVAQKGPRGHRR